MTKKNKKGFTLTELIVVIAIIAILAAVLIPTSISFIQKAKLSSDTQDLANMNRLITYNMLEQGKSTTDIHQVYQWLYVEAGYPLKAKSKGYTYWFDRETNKLVLAKTDSILSGGDDIHAASIYQRDEVGVIASDEKYVLIDQGESDIVNAVNGIRNLADESINDFNNYLNTISNNTVKSYINEFNPDNCIYISDNNFLVKPAAVVKASKIVYQLGISIIPEYKEGYSIALVDRDSEQAIKILLPETVNVIRKNSFSKVTSIGNKIEKASGNVNNVLFETGSLSTELKQLNDQISEMNAKRLSYTNSYTQAEVFYTTSENEKKNKVVNYTSGSLDKVLFGLADSDTIDKWFLIYTPKIENENNALSFNINKKVYGDFIKYDATIVTYTSKGTSISILDSIGYFFNVVYSIEEETNSNKVLNVKLPFNEDDLKNLSHVDCYLNSISDENKLLTTSYGRYSFNNYTFVSGDKLSFVVDNIVIFEIFIKE